MNTSAPPRPSNPIDPVNASVLFKRDATVMGVVGMAHASSHFGHLLLASLFPIFITEFNLSYSQLGFLVTVFFVISGVGQALAGFVVDKVGARPVLVLALSLFITACLCAGFANGYTGLMMAAALAGMANASFHPVDFSILNQQVSSKRLGYAFSVHGITGNLGWALSPVWMVGFAAAFHWRVAYFAAAALYLVVLLTVLYHRNLLSTQTVSAAKGAAQSGLGFLKLPVVWWCFGYFMLSTMTLAVVQSFAAPLLQKLHGVGLQAATLTLTAYMVAGAVGMLVGGWVAVRAPTSDKVVASCMTAAALLLALCATGWLGALGTCAVLAATGFAIGIGGPSRDMMIKKGTPQGATGRVYGMVYSGLDVGFAISPVLFGWLMDHGHYQATLYGAAAVLFLSVGAALGVGYQTDKTRV